MPRHCPKMIGELSMDRNHLTWARGIKACGVIVAALEKRPHAVTELRPMLVSAGFNDNEISELFSVLRNSGAVLVRPEGTRYIWSLNKNAGFRLHS